MLTVRIIPCLDLHGGKVVKGTHFRNLKVIGDPVQLARHYEVQGADELILLDISATVEGRKTMLVVLERIASEVFIPITAGGGIASLEDMQAVLLAGADKITMCTAALNRPELIDEGAKRFGSQCIVISIDAKRHADTWYAYTHSGKRCSGKPVLEWARECEQRGAGELLINSIDRDGTAQGYDTELLQVVADAVSIPVIASSGGAHPEHALEAVRAGADAVLLASALHTGKYTVAEFKRYLAERGIPVRPVSLDWQNGV